MGQSGEHFLTFGVGLGKLLEHGVMPFSELSYFLGPFGGNGPGAAVASSRDRFAEAGQWADDATHEEPGNQ